jgi:hypothetical protein
VVPDASLPWLTAIQAPMVVPVHAGMAGAACAAGEEEAAQAAVAMVPAATAAAAAAAIRRVMKRAGR